MHDLGAVVVCGGKSLRMGADKAWLPFGPETLLERVVRRIAPAVGPVVVVAAPDQPLPPLPAEVVAVRDRSPGQGPLGGLCDGLAVLAARARFAYVCSVDAPFVATAFVRRMRALCGGEAAVPEVAGRKHPLAAVYAVGLWGLGRALLSAGERRALALGDRAGARVVGADDLLADERVRADDPQLETLVNLNTRQDYRAALARAGLGAGR